MAIMILPSGSGGGLTWSKITANTTATKDNGYLISASGNLTLTLPASPSEGDTVGVVDADGKATTTLTIARNGSNIQGDASDLTIDVNRAGFTLVYSNAAQGWVISTEISGSGSLSWNTVTANTSATSGNGYLIVASGNVTITLPSSPSAGDTVGVVDAGGKASTYTLTVARNGSNIQGDASDLTIDTDRSGFTLSYADASNGWVIVSELTIGSGDASSSNAYVGWSLENDVTTDQTPTTSDVGQMYRFISSTTADRTFTLPSVGATEDGKLFWVANESAYTITVQPSDTDRVWKSGAGYGIELVEDSVVCLRYDHSKTTWEMINKTGGMVKLEGLGLHCNCHEMAIYQGNTDWTLLPDLTKRHSVQISNQAWINPPSAFGLNGSLDFNGSNYGNVADHSDWDVFANTIDSYTVAAWFYFDSVSGFDFLISQYEDGSNEWVIMRSGAAIRLRYTRSGSADIDVTGGTISVSTWHHCAFVKIGSETGAYIDGSQVIYDASFTADTFAGVLQIGRYGGGTDYFQGQMNDLIIANQNIYDAAPNATNTDNLSNWNKVFVGVQ